MINKMKTIDLSKPIKLLSSRAWRTYLGGKMISLLHGECGEDEHFPEEWLMSTVAARNSGREHIIEGITKIAETDQTLAELIEKNPITLLGADHIERHGHSLGVLVKLLDAAERLTLQVHPSKERARELFQSEFGKTECWHIIDSRKINNEKPCIYIGFKESITRAYWKECFESQDIPAMLNCLHKVEVQTGDTFIIRGGVPHGIGAGCFLVEIQEPTDYTVRTERVTPSGFEVADFMCHQGLGFEKMFDCFSYEGASLSKTLDLYKVEPIKENHNDFSIEHLIYPAITDLFSMDMISVKGQAEIDCDRFSGIYVLEGEGTLNGEPVQPCDHYFLGNDCKHLSINANKEKPLKIIRCFGPNVNL